MNNPQAHRNKPAYSPYMANQVSFEGFLTKAWEHDGRRYIRLANNRAPENGGPLHSDYVTVELDPGVVFDGNRARPGLQINVRGRLNACEIPETIRTALRKSGHPNTVLPTEIANLVIMRATIRVYATYLEFVRARQAQRPHEQKARSQAAAPAAEAVAPSVCGEAEGVEAAVEPVDEKDIEVRPGADVADVAAKIDKVRAAKATKKGATVKTEKKARPAARKKAE